jgi:hypothetical protein
MPNAPALFTPRRIAICLTLVTLLASVYMLTYSGRIESSDTRALFDVTSSFMQYGDFYLDSSAWYNYPSPTATGQYPLVWSNTEPLQPLLASALFWIAYHMPGIGLAHSVWLFNVFVCAAAGGVFFWYVLSLGYRELTAVISVLALGLLTIIWPYSKTFFREPLALLMLLLAAFFIEWWRAGRYRSFFLLLAILLSLLGGWLSKEAVIFAVPALLVIAAPAILLSPLLRQLLRVLVIGSCGVLGLLALMTIFLPESSWSGIYNLLMSLTGYNYIDIRHTPVAIHTYLFSVGGSVWGTSPILLLAIPGLWWLYRRENYRYILVILFLLLGFSGGYAVLRGIHWFGGLSWPPRFLIPIIPLLMIGVLPVIEWLTKRLFRLWAMAGVLILAAYSFWIQLNGLVLPWEVYNQILPPEAGGLGEWSGGLNQVAYLRWVMLPPLWSTYSPDFAWVRVNILWWPILFITLIGICSLLLVRLLYHASNTYPHWQRIGAVAVPLALLAFCWFGLRGIYRDPLYLGDRDSLHSFMPSIEAVGTPGDVLLLSNTHYAPFFMNYGKFDFPRVITLSDQPGEQPSPEQPAQITSDNPDLLMLPITPPLIFNLAATRERLWLLSDASQWLPWRVRPAERFMGSHYYPIQELSTEPPDPEIRMIEYNTTSAPEMFGFRGAEQLTDLRYGSAVQLAGFTLPNGTVYHPGDALPLSLYWIAESPPAQDYTVALFLVAEDGSRVVQGVDTQPYWGFAPTSRWEPNVPVWDHRALRLPPDLQPGSYQLWVRLYQSDSPENVLSVTGSRVDQDTTGILPVRIDILP